VSWERDRDANEIPDWQEDENYLDEAPIRGPGSPRARLGGGSGCALPVALLLAAATLVTRRTSRRRRAPARPAGLSG
jgi:hypothetical protein